MTAPIGSGHIRAAEAVASALQNSQVGIETRVVNIFDFLPRYFGRSILQTYFQILKIIPRAYGVMYGWGNSSTIALKGRELISKILAKRMLKYINDYQPSVIVCTHATPAGIIASLIRNGKITIPAIAIITDFVVHRLWVYPELSHYYVANEAMREFLAEYNVPLLRSTVSGIPIAKEFGNYQERDQLAAKLGLDIKMPTLLIMGGGAGVLPMDDIIAACDALPGEYQILAVTGNNRAMYDRLQQLRGSLKQHLHVFGYINNTHELMAVADLLISKPGGLTSAEAMTSGLPLVIYRPIPGQEEANTRYLTAQKVALRANSVAEVPSLITSLFNDDHPRLLTMKDCARAHGHPHAAATIAADILRQCPRSVEKKLLP
jgi:processive 1,2-diacylglycerol beta-glucosyltransferase